ncbi:MAG: sterol desaturase family protein [Deltaproteobacteria bacterium]|jgi:sterol desaturase/sphingolipid hydroxylase (fatty acid hydroxylase superfamily)|nr:sterol desaturase family protein [Deltaproteobacteria bacterium]
MNPEITIRLSFFFSIFILLALWELLNPRRALGTSKKMRWFNNLVIVLLDTVIVRLLFPLVPMSMALLAQERGWGLFNNLGVPYLLEVTVAVIVLDFVIYLQHVLFHAVPLLWRFHMVHHADLDLDVTSGVRFHPIEIILSMGIKLAAVGSLGLPALAVFIFEILLNGTSMFNHSNVFIPLKLDRIIRLLIVTPDMHRVHHSVILRETDSNYGFTLSWWDRLLGTYRAQPAKGHQWMTIGLSRFLDEKRQTLLWLLALPFLKKAK